jgi:hypothetical protein
MSASVAKDRLKWCISVSRYGGWWEPVLWSPLRWMNIPLGPLVVFPSRVLVARWNYA